MLGGNKSSYILTETYNEKLIVSVSTHDLLLPPTIKGLRHFYLHCKWIYELVNVYRLTILSNFEKINKMYVTKYMFPARPLKSEFW